MVAQENIIENITLAVSSVVDACLAATSLKASLQVFFRIPVISFPSPSCLWINSIDGDGRSSNLSPSISQSLHHHHLSCKELLDGRHAKEVKKDENENHLENKTGACDKNLAFPG